MLKTLDRLVMALANLRADRIEIILCGPDSLRPRKGSRACDRALKKCSPIHRLLIAVRSQRCNPKVHKFTTIIRQKSTRRLNSKSIIITGCARKQHGVEGK